MNWLIKSLEVFFPQLKRIIIDMNDEKLFRKIDSSDGQRMVALVNQWHMEGIEHEWASRYGQVPRSVYFKDINPIGDMDLRRGLYYLWYNYSKR